MTGGETRFPARRRRLRALLDQAELDGLLVSSHVNVRYLTGFTGSAGTLLVRGDRELLVTDGRYAEQAVTESPELPLLVTRGDAWLREEVGDLAGLGVEAHAVSWERARALAELLGEDVIVPAGRLVEGLRAEKDDDELAALERACAITAEAIMGMGGWLAPGLTERAVARRLLDDFLRLGADDRAFELIVASGPNTALPHHRPGSRVLEVGDLVLCDVGALVDGYHADMTRVLALGEPGSELRRVHRIVAAAQRAGVERVAAGVTAGAVDAACRDPIASAGFGERFVHPTGHAVGLEIHEQPILRSGAADRLRTRMTLTVEPGIYLAGLGGVRIEDVVAVTESGVRTLTRAPTDLAVL